MKESEPMLRAICLPSKDEQAKLATILEESAQFGVKMDEASWRAFNNPIIDGEVTLYNQNTLMDIRRLMRIEVLRANGANLDNYDLTGSDVLEFRNQFNKIIASGEHQFLKELPLVRTLESALPFNVDWHTVQCWDLGNPDFYLKEESTHFKRVNLNNWTFLFKSEIEELSAKGRAITYQNSNFDMGFQVIMAESYITLRAQRYPSLYRIRAIFID